MATEHSLRCVCALECPPAAAHAAVVKDRQRRGDAMKAGGAPPHAVLWQVASPSAPRAPMRQRRGPLFGHGGHGRARNRRGAR